MAATELTKKLMIIIVAFCLVLCSGIIALAENKTAYFEYLKEEGKEDYYPKVGFDWQMNYYWGFSASHQFEVDGDSEGKTYFEIRRGFIDQQLTLAFSGEVSESYNAVGARVSAYFPLNDSLSCSWAITYNSYFARSGNPYALDYNSLKAFSEFRYRVNKKLSALINGEWRTYHYEVNDTVTSDPDYTEVQLSTGLGYQIKENFYIGGVYNWLDTNYEDPALDKLGRGLILSSNYTYKNYTFYLTYPSSQKNDHTAVIGLAYAF